MSKKGLKSMKDENQELQKQIGCISGFFLMFDRHRFLTGQSNSHNNIPNQGGTSNNIKELNNATQKAKNVKVARENQPSSTESSSGTSMFSSSCSSSMSSLEFNRTIQIEPPPSITQVKINEKSSSEEEVKQRDKGRQESLDFHDIVKDSMRMDSQRLSVKTVAKQEKKSRILKNVDSPRPMAAWDSPRLSYDGRDTQSTLKSATKFKELPRLSLDSKERSIKSFNEGTKTRNLLKGPQKVCGSSNPIEKQVEEPESARRPSSVVAKLMGIEAFPDWSETCDSCNTNKNESFVGSRMSDEYRKDGSIMNVSPYSKCSKSSESSTKASNRSLSVYGEIEKRMADLEFKKSGKDLRALKQILEAMHRYKESIDTTSDQASNSPYDNMSNSSVSESLSAQSPRTPQKNPTSIAVGRPNSTQGSKSPIVIIKPAKVARKTNNSSSTESSIHGKSSSSKVYRGDATNVKAPRDKSNKITSKLIQSSKVPRVVIAESNTSSNMMAETRSPRLQKKFGLEKRSPPTSPSSDISGNRRQQNKQSTELSSPSKTPRQKFSTKERNEIFGEIGYQRRDFKQVEAVSSGDIKDSSNENFTAETKVTAEQPSPVSVLDASFYREDPPSPVKRKSDISKDFEEVLNNCDISEDSEDVALSSNMNAKLNFSDGTNDLDLITHNLVQVLQQFEHSEDERFKNFSDHDNPDHKYITEILLASGRLTSPGSSYTLHLSGHPINPTLFLALEKIKTNATNLNIAQTNNTQEKMQRKLVFDVVNEILFQKLITESSYKPYHPEQRKPEGQHLLDMLCTEIDKLQHNNRNVDLADEDEFLTSIVSEDLVQHSATTECCNEIPNLVLDIERLIFKDLITEIVRSE
ncbi:protein LONGIFOLIA 1-like [Vicia villosa]|uniref:protein LONGIFOLIA 1-like n=1 Tax=Vicia villosa TaxID=3911 RepID=UPI00273C26F4|nr:protein LONGIFOLIA 1-like [Vicia villosa]